MEKAQKSDSCQLRLEQTQKHPSPTYMLRLFSFDSHAIQNSPWPQEHLHRFRNRSHVGIWTSSHDSMRSVLVSDSFIPKGPWELLWLVQSHRPVFGSVKLAPIKYEKSFLPRHVKSDEGLFWKAIETSPYYPRRLVLLFLQVVCICHLLIVKVNK